MVDDLVDQYRLLVFPTLLGKGHRPFDAVSAPVELELVSIEDAGGGAIRQVHNRRRSA
jgi:dihydrofolate reductase